MDPPPSSEVNITFSGSRNPPTFKEPKGSFPCLQDSASTHYLDINTVHTLQHCFLCSTLISSCHLGVCLSSGLFFSDLPTIILYAFLMSAMRATCYGHLIICDLVILRVFSEENKLRTSSLWVFSNSLLHLLC
jgi:hypothetical protein